MDYLELYLTLIETVKAGDDILYIFVSVYAVNDLLSQRILLVFINCKVGTQPLVEKGVKVLKNDFYSIFASFLEQLPRQHNLMIAVDDLCSLN